MSKLSLHIESSALPYGVVIADGENIIFDSTEHEALANIKDVPALTLHALQTLQRPAKDIEIIMINKGPGGTSAIRSGVSFANSLGYSLSVPVIGINAFELLGFPNESRFGCPVLTTIKSVRGNAYVGLFADGQLRRTAYGPMLETVTDTLGDTTEWAIAGAHRAELIAHFAAHNVHDTEQKFGVASTMPALLDGMRDLGKQFPEYIIPLTEQAPIFTTNPIAL